MARKLFITVFALLVSLIGSPVMADSLGDARSLRQKASLNYQKYRRQRQGRKELDLRNEVSRLRPKKLQSQKHIRFEDAMDDIWEILRFK